MKSPFHSQDLFHLVIRLKTRLWCNKERATFQDQRSRRYVFVQRIQVHGKQEPLLLGTDQEPLR